MSMVSPRWAIRITYPNGKREFLRYANRAGEPVVKFRTKRDAELNAEAFIWPGLDKENIVTVVKLR